MIINFVTVANETMASYRYHNEIPAKALNKRGHTVFISAYPLTQALDVVVFSKHFNHGDIWYLRGCKTRGIKTVFHCCDNHFETKEKNHYRSMLFEADEIIASTEEMASLIKVETGRTAKVIYDAYEFEEAPPLYHPQEKLKLLWFGHPTNIGAFLDKLEVLKGHQFMIVTDPSVQKNIKINNKPIHVVPYSKANLIEAMKGCDAVIIPSEMGPRQTVKSPNRLVESVRRGKFVIADPIPSYLAFEDYCFIGDIEEGIKYLQEAKEEVIEKRLTDGQAYIRENHSPEKIGKEWEGVCQRDQ